MAQLVKSPHTTQLRASQDETGLRRVPISLEESVSILTHEVFQVDSTQFHRQSPSYFAGLRPTQTKPFKSIQHATHTTGLVPFALVLLLLPQTSTPAPSSCYQDAFPPSILGFVALPPGLDFPGNDLQYFPPLTSTSQCIQACMAFPAGECVMVTTTTAGECWLKSAVGPTTAANSAVLAFALPCNVQTTCGEQLCRQEVGPTSVQCQCLPPQDVAYEPTVPFNARFVQYDTTWGGSSIANDSYSCVASCSLPDVSCVLAVYNPGTRQCFLKYKYQADSFVVDPSFDVFVRICSNNNGNCGQGQGCRTGPPTTCVNVSDYNFKFLFRDIDLQGTNLISYPDMDSATCVESCSAIPKCKVAQSNPTTRHCWLKSSVGTPIAAVDYITFGRVGFNL